MPGAGIQNFMRKAADIAKAGIYDLRVHRDEVLMPVLKSTGRVRVDRSRRRGRGGTQRLAHRHLDKLDAAAKRFEERLARSSVPRMHPA